MGIQSSVNALIGSIGAIKRAHDLGIKKQAEQSLEQQKVAIRQQRLDVESYIAKTKRKRLNLEIRKEKANEQRTTKTL